MMTKLLSKSRMLLLTLAVGMICSTSAFGTATIVIKNSDPAGVGFNDPTPVAPVGGNPGTTLGQQRYNAFQFAANIWGATLSSGPTITVSATWSGLECTANSAVLGSAGTINLHRNFLNAPFANTWFATAEANALAGSDLNGSGAEIEAEFNLNIGTPGCLENKPWYYGLDTNHGTGRVNLVSVVLHELGHGLGFSSFTNEENGRFFTGGNGVAAPSAYDRFLLDNTTGKTWPQMTDAERMASAVNSGNLVWNGPQVIADATFLTSGKDSSGRPRLYAPNPINGGSSVSHWDTVLTSNQLMEPFINTNLSFSVTTPQDLTYSLLKDIGWCTTCPGVGPVPANDNLADAQAISGCTGSVSGTNVGSTHESNEPSHSPDGNGGSGSVWYQWQAPSSGSVTITTAGSDYDSLLAVYTGGTSVGSLTLVANNDDVDSTHVNTTSSVTFTATAGTTYKIAVDGWGGATGSVVLNWTTSTCAPSKTDQTINFAPLSGRTYGGAPFTISASASSGLPVSFSLISGPATVSGSTVTITGVGTVTIRASQAGNATYNPAPSVDQSFTVAKANQTITFNSLSDKTYGDAPFIVSASASSGLPVSFAILSGPATISNTTITLTGTGTVTVRASQAGDANYNPASVVDRLFTVAAPAKINQTITFNALSDKTYGDAPFTVSATSTSGLPVSFGVSGPATISGNTVTIIGVGTVTVTASQAGDATYNAAAPVSRFFTVNKSTPVVTWNNPADITYGTALGNTQLNATTPVAGTFAYTPAAGTILNAGAGQTLSVTFTPTNTGSYNSVSKTVTINVLKFTPGITWNAPAGIAYGTALSSAQLNATAPVAGTFTYNPPAGTVLNAGNTQTLSADFTPTDTFNYNTASKSVLINVSKAGQTINFDLIPSKTFGDAPFQLNATSLSGLPVSLQIISGPATISGNTVTITGVGDVTVRATQAGDSNYNAATPVDRTFNVVSAGANVVLANLAHTYDGTAKFATATTSPGLTVSITYSQNGAPITSPTNAGSYTVTATITSPGFTGTATGTLVINKATPVLTWNNPANIMSGTPLSSTQLNASANVPGNFLYNPIAGTVLGVSTYQLAATFIPSDVLNYNTALVNAQLTVVPAITLLTEEDNVHAVALDSVTLMRGPFRVLNLLNFSADQRTRVTIFTSNLGSLSLSDLSVQAGNIPLPIESIGTVRGLVTSSYIVVKLVDGLPAGDLSLTVSLQGVTSNTVKLSIAP